MTLELDDQMIKEFAGTIKYHAMRYAHRLPPELGVEDLISVGLHSLVESARRFDPSRGLKFKTMAEHRIRGAMLDEIRSMDWVPRSVREKQADVQMARESLERELGRHPEDAELAARLGLSLEDLETLLWEIDPHPVLSLDEVFGPDESEGESLGDHLPGPKGEDPLSRLLQGEALDALAGALDALPEKQRLVLTLYYYEELTMKEVAQVLDVSESRVSQIHSQALRGIRALLEERRQTSSRQTKKQRSGK
jgi:RNA polymerase sigma factor for flagellar operon FliA|uniref:RNA polymerase, sigma 28 subunit, FliA/WhiG n=1 Tax=Leptospirillum ferrodiazotrophum TaxID=412449 RepID=C6HWL6_9BACT|nr:MAG: RNA polymerase, sigma 28 subunit, FliA/WhiG [Leptospirillum ferrodiazotrophum]